MRHSSERINCPAKSKRYNNAQPIRGAYDAMMIVTYCLYRPRQFIKTYFKNVAKVLTIEKMARRKTQKGTLNYSNKKSTDF